MKYIYNLIVAVAAVTMLVSCDDVKLADRYIELEAVESNRAVLLEDFTGQYCINCPDAHAVMEQLVEQYGADKVIAVSIHCGDFGVSVANSMFEAGFVGLMSEEGNAIMQSYGIEQFPMGVINMGSPLVYDLWPTAVRNALLQTTDVKLDADVEWIGPEEGENTGTIRISADILSSSQHSAMVQFWVVEDGIVALQRSKSGIIPQYVHNNVFRAQVFEPIKGKNIELQPGIYSHVNGEIETRYNNQERWVPENLSIVAFVSDASGVLQVIKTPVIPKSTEDNQ